MQNGTNQTPRQWVLNEDGNLRFDAMPIIEFIYTNFYSAQQLKENLQQSIDWLVLENAENETPDELFPDVYKALITLRDVFASAEFMTRQPEK